MKEITKKRETLFKKGGPQADDSIFVKDLGDLAYAYEDMKQTGDKKIDEMKGIVADFASSIKDDIRKTFVHFISLMKNIEYDVNTEIEVFSAHYRNLTKRRSNWMTFFLSLMSLL